MSVIRNLLQIKGNTIVWAVEPDNTVLDAIKIMANKDIGALVVMSGDKLVGIISERDCVRKVMLQGKQPAETLVEQIMTRAIRVIHPSQTVEEAMELMNSHQIRHLPVVDENEKVIGVISIKDVLRDVIYRQREKIKRIAEETK